MLTLNDNWTWPTMIQDVDGRLGSDSKKIWFYFVCSYYAAQGENRERTSWRKLLLDKLSTTVESTELATRRNDFWGQSHSSITDTWNAKRIVVVVEIGPELQPLGKIYVSAPSGSHKWHSTLLSICETRFRLVINSESPHLHSTSHAHTRVQTFS